MADREETPLTNPTSTITKPVGSCGCKKHSFPNDSDHVLLLVVNGFQQDFSNGESKCACLTWKHDIPEGDKIAAILPSELTRYLSTGMCSDISNRVNNHSKRYIGGLVFMLSVFGTMALHLVLRFLLGMIT